jgi:hypothetical protein
MCPACIAAAALLAAKLSTVAGFASVAFHKLAAKTEAPSSPFKPNIPARDAGHS